MSKTTNKFSPEVRQRAARLVTVAIANKTARIAWAILAHGGTYRAPRAT